MSRINADATSRPSSAMLPGTLAALESEFEQVSRFLNEALARRRATLAAIKVETQGDRFSDQATAATPGGRGDSPALDDHGTLWQSLYGDDLEIVGRCRRIDQLRQLIAAEKRAIGDDTSQ